VSIDKGAWRALPTALQRATLRRGVRELRPGLRDVSYRHIEDARRLGLAGSPGAQATLPGHLVLRVGYDTLTLADIRSEAAFPDEPLIWGSASIAVSVPGTTLMPGSPWGLVATELHEWDLDKIRANEDEWTAYVDGDQLREAVALRTREPGDAFKPQGMGGQSVKLGAFLINRKVPRHVRERVPLLVSSGRILWVCGHRLAEGAGVRSATNRVVRLRFERFLGEAPAAGGRAAPRRDAPGDGNA
jgi:tRNA(Ile)-lysidine synthase